MRSPGIRAPDGTVSPLARPIRSLVLGREADIAGAADPVGVETDSSGEIVEGLAHRHFM